MSSSHIQFEKKELAKLNKITDDDGFIERGEFFEYARKSVAMKEYTEKHFGTGRKVSQNNSTVALDKAELTFKVKDTNKSQFVVHF